MVELNPNESFEKHVEDILETVDDEGVKTIIRNNINRIISMSASSSTESRSPIVENIEDLVQNRFQEE